MVRGGGEREGKWGLGSIPHSFHSTVTDFAKFRGLSTSHPRSTAT